MARNVINIPTTYVAPSKSNNSGHFFLVLLTQIAVGSILAALFLARRADGFDPIRMCVLYGPRFFFCVPLLILIPWAIYLRNRWILSELIFSLLVIVVPLMGLNTKGMINSSRPGNERSSVRIRLLSYNIGPTPIEFDRLVDYIKKQDIHILLIQEDTNVGELASKLRAELGWHMNRNAKIFSRFPIVAESDELPHEVGGDKLYIAKINIVRMRKGESEFLVGSAHAPSIRHPFHNFIDNMNIEELNKAMRWQKRQLERVAALMDTANAIPLVVAGDFNSPPNSVLSRPLERRFLDVFAEVGKGYGFTFPAMFPWIRLDKFYVSRGWTPLQCFVAYDFGSDHLPLFAELILDEKNKMERPKSIRTDVSE